MRMRVWRLALLVQQNWTGALIKRQQLTARYKAGKANGLGHVLELCACSRFERGGRAGGSVECGTDVIP